MGPGLSHERYDKYALEWYEHALQSRCSLLPDVGIDESLWKYSGINSHTELQDYSNGLISSVPGFVEKLGSGLGALTSIPNAVGLGAMVISMIMEICIKTTETSEDSYSMLRRVFGEEKASGVRDTMSEYLKRHRIYINNDHKLLDELQILERQLSGKLTILRNSLLHDGQMSARGFKIWVNGASFHLQMLIHKARLDIQAGKPESDLINEIRVAFDVYLQDLGRLMEKFKTYIGRITSFKTSGICSWGCKVDCFLTNSETKCDAVRPFSIDIPCTKPEVASLYMNHIFTKYEPILSLNTHFSSMKNNINSLIHQHDAFTVPSAT